MWTKIYAHSSAGAEAFDSVLDYFAQRPTIVTTGPDTWFVGLPALATTRTHLAALDGVTVLPAHVAPGKLSAKHVALLSAHGVGASDTAWSAIEKVRAKHGLPDHFDPNV